MNLLAKVGSVILFVFYVVIVLALICSFAAASSFISEGYACNLNDETFIKGIKIVYLSGKAGDTLTLKVNGETIYPTEAYHPEIRVLYQGGNGIEGSEIKTDGTANAANKIGLNGKTLGRFPSDGSIGVGIRTSRFKEGENAISVIIGGFWGDGPYDEKRPHGIAAGNQGKNKDDFILSNVRFLLPDGKEILPDGLVSYKAKEVGSKEKVVKRYESYPYKENEPFWLGDGWGSFDTWAGNTTNRNVINSIDQGRLDIPYKVEFLLNYQKPGSEAMFALDTSSYQDGIQTIEAYAGDSCVWRGDVIIDNSQPIVTTNLLNQQNIANGFVLEANFSDETSGIKTHVARLEGKEIGSATNIKYKFDNLKPGVYSVVLEASDNAGNTIYPCFNFNVVEKLFPDYLLKNEKEGYSLQVNGENVSEVTIYQAEPLAFTSYYGTVAEVTKLTSKQPFPDSYTYNIAKGLETVTTTAISGMPYHAFDVDITGANSKEVLLNYQGSTREGERLALKAYNPQSSTWDTLATGIGSVKLLASVQIADYASNGKIRVMVVPDYVDNGSDTILWITDPQHYTKFPDLNDFYYKIYQYAANEYLENNIGYLINTGDLVDDSPSSSLANNQWQIAEKALNYAEGIGVPSGVVSGNHDTGNYPNANYSLFWQYFGADRYRDKPYYGGNLNNNASHYDLVTIGNNDLVVLYLGYGVEGTPETVAWANQVLKSYSHRQAIICTHQYLSATGGYDVTSRANVIFNQIVVPNENAKMLLCGHNNGSVCLEKKIGERVFYELLSDYQFVQLERDSYYQGNKHYIGTVPFCNGEGYLRSLRFAGNKVQVKTFSPITGGKNPFGIRDDFEIVIDFPPSARKITTQSFSAVTVGKKVETKKLSTNEIYQGNYKDNSKALVAVITNEGDNFFTSIVKNDNSPKKSEAILLPADLSNLNVLFNQAKSLSKVDYLNDSFAKLEACLKEVAATLALPNPTEKQVVDAYSKLSRTITALQEKGEGVLDPNDLELLYDYNLDIDTWVNSAGPIKLNATGSYLLAEQLQNGGLKIDKSSSAPNNWPQMKYKTANITVTPVDGKVYLYLDINASSSWVLFPIIKQGKRSANFRLNYVIEGLTNMEADGGPGVFKGIYDVTEALRKRRFDLTQPLEITMMINAVPGPVTINRLAIMTNKMSTTIEE